MPDTKKEKEPVAGTERVRVPDEVVTVEAPKQQENLEALSWVEKIEKRFARVPNSTSDVTDDTVVVQSLGDAQGKQPPVTLPVNQHQMMVGKKAKTDLGIAWLVTWVVRQIKMLAKLGRGVRFQDLPETKEGDGRT